MSVVFDGFSWKCKCVYAAGTKLNTKQILTSIMLIYQVIFHIYFKKYSPSCSICTIKRMCKPFECFDVSHYSKNTYQSNYIVIIWVVDCV